MPRQFENPANPYIHEISTGPEIWAATRGRVDIIVAGLGTGGTITGVARHLRRRNPNLQAIAVEPRITTRYLWGTARNAPDPRNRAGFVPNNLDQSLLTAVETVSSEEAFAWARRLARKKASWLGLVAGPIGSSGKSGSKAEKPGQNHRYIRVQCGRTLSFNTPVRTDRYACRS